ncbi:MAG: DUF4276 family protein [Deltaproteobacteria bacterium]|nr:DUF4276 family protein [Deltaproteobacteria bacterium]
MAMVVWFFAGGGESEVEGLVPFLEVNFPGCNFERKTPIKSKPGSKPGRGSGYGLTGRGLAKQIKERLKSCMTQGQLGDLILVIDDLDCHDSDKKEGMFVAAISSVAGADEIPRYVGFASPEIEAWIIADWDNTLARHPDFHERQAGMRDWLSENGIGFDEPESFSQLNKYGTSCDSKLSDLIIESSQEKGCKQRYRKGMHTPELIKKINPDTVSSKCPHFKKLYNYLRDLCDQREPQIN